MAHRALRARRMLRARKEWVAARVGCDMAGSRLRWITLIASGVLLGTPVMAGAQAASGTAAPGLPGQSIQHESRIDAWADLLMNLVFGDSIYIWISMLLFFLCESVLSRAVGFSYRPRRYRLSKAR